MAIAITPLTAAIAERAAAARVRYGRLRLPDAIVLACADELDGELLSYDKRLAQNLTLPDNWAGAVARPSRALLRATREGVRFSV
jgi:predicted nucleic acid-binding protein